MQQVPIYLVIIWPTNTVAFNHFLVAKFLSSNKCSKDPDTEIESELVWLNQVGSLKSPPVYLSLSYAVVSE